MSAHSISIHTVARINETKLESREEGEVNICPIMKKNGYLGKIAQCSFPEFKKKIPVKYRCCSKDNQECFLLKVPGHTKDRNLLEEIVLAEYYEEDIHEKEIKEEIISFFDQINQNKNYS